MKKNMILRKALVSTMAIAMLMGTTTFAAETTKVEEPVVTSSNEDATNAKEETKFVTYAGKVSSVTANEDKETVTVIITNDSMGLIANIDKSTVVLEAGEYKTMNDIKEGADITFVIPAMAPMGLSMPPYTGSVAVAIIGSETTSVDVSKYDADLTSKTASLKLNISDETKIVDLKGTKKVFTAEDVKNTESIVFYTVTTRSIPAQTSPLMVMILDSAIEDVEAPSETPTPEEAPSETPAPEKAEYVSLRSTAEKAGFAIKWTSNTAPIMLEKGDVKITVTIGSKVAMVGTEKMELSLETKLEKDTTVVSSELLEKLK